MASIRFRTSIARGLGGAVALVVGFSAAAVAEQSAPALSPIEQLGSRLFSDVSLSEPKGVSCASCHDPARAFSGVNGSSVPAVARGAPAGAFGSRKPPSVSYASFAPPFSFVDKKDEETGKVEKTPVGGQFRDGRASDLIEQAGGPLLNPVEMNNPSREAVVAKVKGGAYADLARTAFGKDVFDNPGQAFDKLMQAIAAFERTEAFHPFASRFDAVLRGEAKFTPLEARGFALFKDPHKGNCLACHAGDVKSHDPKDWLFTDFTYDTLGAPRNGAIPANAAQGSFDLGLCARPGLAASAPKGFETEGVCGAFKVPTLRNVAVTAPYMHNGSLATLRDAVAFYATRDTNPERWYPKGADGKVSKFDDLPSTFHANVNVKEVPYDRKPGQKPRLSDDEIDAIVAFLETLTDKRGN
ncbi:cytochrome-c peroxidase [Methylocystis heyeri]|uniref:C-type cytochrome n=1 Tax=Methylocystis heyeri TaxID=391905 RepID=A0A6B8K9E2_9HYPH|nr:cytochrome c peroxidase [Methylocystis heyeri]QGM44469.1 c-type cytochrome [Methylocystis heyeri]